MTKFEDNQSPYLTVLSQAAPTSPASGRLRLYVDTDGLLKTKDSGGVVGAYGSIGNIAIQLDGFGADIDTGVQGYFQVPFACVITAARLLADQSGSMVVDIWKDAYANYPPTVADTITAAAKPTLSAAVKSEDTTLTGWTTAIAAGDILGFNVDSCSGVQRATLSLTIRRV